MDILFVDDDEVEASSFKVAVSQLGNDIRISHIPYCMEVLWLLKRKKHDMVILRLNEETKVGIYFLQTIRSMKELGALPVIMYSTLMTDCYVDRCYNGKANYYLQKQDDMPGTLKAFEYVMSANLTSQTRISKTTFVL